MQNTNISNNESYKKIDEYISYFNNRQSPTIKIDKDGNNVEIKDDTDLAIFKFSAFRQQTLATLLENLYINVNSEEYSKYNNLYMYENNLGDNTTNESILSKYIKYKEINSGVYDATFMSYNSEGNGLPVGEFKQGNGFNISAAIERMYNDIDFPATSKHSKITKAAVNGSSLGLCAFAVKTFLAAGGIPYVSGNANQCGIFLPNFGFKNIIIITGTSNQSKWTNAYAKSGDVAIMLHGQYGHICMYNEMLKKWVSDFPQNNMWPYKDNKETCKCYIFRYNG